MNPEVHQFLSGASMLGSAVISLYFLRFWKETRDRLFAIFSLAFFTFGMNRLLLSILDDRNEAKAYVYLVRLAAFVLILVAIVDKNRPTNSSEHRSTAKQAPPPEV